MILRPYQQRLEADIYGAWAAGHGNVLAVLPTGGGKTPIFCKVLQDNGAPACALVHRQELIAQMSLTLARFDVPHRIVGPESLVKLINWLHVNECGTSYYSATAGVGVASVDTITRRVKQFGSWFSRCTLWVVDEAHHVLAGNKWGKAVALFEGARGLGVTATPVRLDGKGLGAHADGVFNTMVLGPTMRELISAGYLCDYRIFNPPSNLDLQGVKVSATTGEISQVEAEKRIRRSTVTGDVVQHYIRLAAGKQGVTFCASVALAHEEAERFNNAGVPAAVLSGTTPLKERAGIIAKYRKRQLLQLVNVDVVSEGFDLDAIEVLSMAAPTKSFGRYCQQFGRPLRPADGKAHAIIIDHVGNVSDPLLGLPDAERVWTLDRAERRRGGERDPNTVPTRTCVECTGVYEAFRIVCPFCGAVPRPIERATVQQVDGDLVEVDPEVLAAMRQAKTRVDLGDLAFRQALQRAGLSGPAFGGALARHRQRREAQEALRQAMNAWGRAAVKAGRQLREAHKLFFIRFGVDVLSAQALGRPEAEALTERIRDDEKSA